MQKFLNIFLNTIPILIMIGLIYFVENDYILTILYLLIIIISLLFIKFNKNDIIIFSFGFLIMILFEYIFVSTGVETFVRNSLFGLMPLWLPFVWGYGFVAIKRSIKILDSNES